MASFKAIGNNVYFVRPVGLLTNGTTLVHKCANDNDAALLAYELQRTIHNFEAVKTLTQEQINNGN